MLNFFFNVATRNTCHQGVGDETAVVPDNHVATEILTRATRKPSPSSETISNAREEHVMPFGIDVIAMETDVTAM